MSLKATLFWLGFAVAVAASLNAWLVAVAFILAGVFCVACDRYWAADA